MSFYYKYNIDQTDIQLRALTERSASNYKIFKIICELAGGFIVSSEKWFVVEIDKEEYFHLVKNLTNKLLKHIIEKRRVEKKEGHGFKLGNLFVTITVYKSMETSPKTIKLEQKKLIRCQKLFLIILTNLA